MKESFLFLVLCLVFISCESKQGKPASQNFEIHELAGGVYALIHKLGGKAISNSGLIDLGDKTVVFDTFLSPVVAEEIPRIAKQLNLSPIRYVVNSHWHDDHIRGNQVFADDVKIISTRRTKELIEQNEPDNLASQKEYAPKRYAYYDSLLTAFTGDTSSREYKKILMWQPYYQVLTEENHLIKTRLPEIFVENQKTITGNKRSLQLISKGAGHTESDLILFLPAERIVFSGDLLFVGMHPYLADGNTDSLIEFIAFINNLGIKKVVPGHGPVGDAKDLVLMISYIKTVRQLAARLLKENKSPDEAVWPAPFNQWWFERFAGWNIEFVYNTLKEN